MTKRRVVETDWRLWDELTLRPDVRVVRGNPNYWIARDGTVWRITPTNGGNGKPIPYPLKPRQSGGRTPSVNLAGSGYPYPNGVRSVAISTLLKETFG